MGAPRKTNSLRLGPRTTSTRREINTTITAAASTAWGSSRVQKRVRGSSAMDIKKALSQIQPTNIKDTSAPTIESESTETNTLSGNTANAYTANLNENRGSTKTCNPFNVQLDLASEASLIIDADAELSAGLEFCVEKANELNRSLLETVDSEEYESDDSLKDSETKQAEEQHKQLMQQLADIDKELLDKWLEHDKNDYKENGSVLDADIVSRRLEELQEFALGLKKIARNHARLLARIKEPLAEEHWLLDPTYHQPLVNTFRTMTNLVNELPRIAEAARHCASPSSVECTSSANDDDKPRSIAHLEQIAHETEQISEWIRSDEMLNESTLQQSIKHVTDSLG